MITRTPSFLGATVALALMWVVPAHGHVRTADDNWLFTGSTYSGDADRSAPPSRDDRSDSMSVIWRGPSGTTATPARAMEHTEQHWRQRRIPDDDRYEDGAFMRPRGGGFGEWCRDPQLVFYRDGNDANRGAWSQSATYMSTDAACWWQYHIRMWSSAIHAGFFGAGEHTAEWVLAPIHHETVSAINYIEDSALHDIDMPWDLTRRLYVRYQMGAVHCVDMDWQMHDESTGFDYQGYEYSGRISRISFRHRCDGCTGA
jgi:hypothetical protein